MLAVSRPYHAGAMCRSRYTAAEEATACVVSSGVVVSATRSSTALLRHKGHELLPVVSH